MASFESLPSDIPREIVTGPRDLLAEEAEAHKTLYYRLGGDAAIEGTVIRFYELVMEDPALLPFFEKVNMKTLKAHQRRFLTLAFTKIPDDFDAISFIVSRHYRLLEKGLNATHFDRVTGHLVTALKEMWAEPELIKEVIGLLGPFRAGFEQARPDAMTVPNAQEAPSS